VASALRAVRLTASVGTPFPSRESVAQKKHWKEPRPTERIGQPNPRRQSLEDWLLCCSRAGPRWSWKARGLAHIIVAAVDQPRERARDANDRRCCQEEDAIQKHGTAGSRQQQSRRRACLGLNRGLHLVQFALPKHGPRHLLPAMEGGQLPEEDPSDDEEFRLAHDKDCQ